MRRFVTIGAAVLFLAVLGSASARKIPVEVWAGGDDGLTRRLRDTLEKRLRNSSDFTLSSGGQFGTLVVTIPTNVDWKTVGNRTQVSYVVEFTSAAKQKLGRSSGKCWEDDLDRCASRIVSDAKSAAQTLR